MNEDQIKGGQMRGHLTSKEISQWLVEGPEQSADHHVQNCRACQAKLAEAKAPLAAFRTALVGWSEAQDAGQVTVQSLEGKSEGHWGLRLWLPVASLALAALLIAGFVKDTGLLHGRSDGQRTAVSSPSSSPDSDAALMDQVDTEVSEAVPDAMAPLIDLVAWDSGEGVGETTLAPEKTAAHKKSNPVAGAKPHAHAAD